MICWRSPGSTQSCHAPFPEQVIDTLKYLAYNRRTVNTKRLTQMEAQVRLARRIREAGSLRQFAQAHAVSPSYVSQVASGKLPIGDRLLEAIGLRRVVEFECVEVKR